MQAEMEKHMAYLQQLKDFDESLAFTFNNFNSIFVQY